MLKVVSAIAALICTSVAVQAGSLHPKSTRVISAEKGGAMHIAARKNKDVRPTVEAFKGGGRHVKDTCPGGDKKCIKDLIANCDKAGGGLSTQPDGGVDCYVVGIHDQP